MGRIVIDREMCKSCGFCVKYCKLGLIKIGDSFNMDGYRYAIPNDPDKKCVACKTCALMCPDHAISVYK